MYARRILLRAVEAQIRKGLDRTNTYRFQVAQYSFLVTTMTHTDHQRVVGSVWRILQRTINT